MNYPSHLFIASDRQKRQVTRSGGSLALMLFVILGCPSVRTIRAQQNPSVTAADRTGTVHLTVDEPKDSWPHANETGVLSPNYTATIRVEVDDDGGKDGVTYLLSGVPTVTTACSETSTLWTPSAGGPGTYSITNTTQNAASANLTVTCLWKPVLGDGNGGGTPPPDIIGNGSANLELTDSVVRWRALKNAAWADDDAQILFQGVFVDDKGFGLERNVIKVVKATQADPHDPGWHTDFSQSSWHFNGNVRSATPSKGHLLIGYSDGNVDGSNETDILADELWFVTVSPGTLAFSGDGQEDVLRDSGGVKYETPQWQRANWDENGAKVRSFPAAYVSDNNVTIDSQWWVKPANFPYKIKMKASSDQLGTFSEEEGSISGNKMLVSGTEQDSALDYKIRYLPSEAIKWSGELEGDTAFKEIATTNQKFYVLLDEPATGLYETLAFIGCSSASGQITPTGAFNSIWNHFKGLDVKNVDGATLCFWGDEQSYQNASDGIALITSHNANCVAWSDLFIKCYEAQGIAGGGSKTIVPKAFKPFVGDVDDRRLLIKAWDISATGTAPAGASPYTNRFRTEVQRSTRIASQGHVPAPDNFYTHTIVSRGGKLYDPSYGLGPYQEVVSYENDQLAGTYGVYSSGASTLEVVKGNAASDADTD